MQKKPLNLDPEIERNFINSIRDEVKKGWKPKEWEKVPPRAVYYIKKAMELEGVSHGQV